MRPFAVPLALTAAVLALVGCGGERAAPDAGRMFLIQPRPGGHYLVRNYDLVRDELMPVP